MHTDQLGTLGTTYFSPCRTYRYTLWRAWDMFNPTVLQVVGLNPSTADETCDDPTIRRCIGYAKRWGYGALCMTNLFAYRSTNPAVLQQVMDPVGPDNDYALVTIAAAAQGILVAWGTHGTYGARAEQVCALLERWPLACLGWTEGGMPRHPLYVRRDQGRMPYRPRPTHCYTKEGTHEPNR